MIVIALLGVIRLDPMVTIASIAAIIGGIVVYGSNTSTADQATAAMQAAEAHRAELIGRIDLRVVGRRRWRQLTGPAPPADGSE